MTWATRWGWLAARGGVLVAALLYAVSVGQYPHPAIMFIIAAMVGPYPTGLPERAGRLIWLGARGLVLAYVIWRIAVFVEITVSLGTFLRAVGVKFMLMVLAGLLVAPGIGPAIWQWLGSLGHGGPRQQRDATPVARPLRLTGFTALLYLLWIAAVGWIVVDAAAEFQALNPARVAAPVPSEPLRLPPGYPPALAQQYVQQYQQRLQQQRQLETALSGGGDAGVFRLICDLWALLGAFGLALVRFNPPRWSIGSRVIWGGFGLAFLIGRPLVGWLGFVMAILPAGDELDFLKFWVAPPVLLWLGGLVVIVTVGGVALTALGLVVGVPAAIFNQILQFRLASQVFSIKQRGLVGYLARFGYWLSGEAVPVTPDDTKGARFATPDEVRALNDERGMAFGHVEGAPLFLHTEKHVLIQASTRSGKGVALILPHLLRYTGSVFCLDPKGENARAAGRYRESVNDATHYLDPFGISGKPRSRFNPLSRFTPDNMEAMSKALATAFVYGTGAQGEDHWVGSAQQLLALAILYVFTEPNISPNKKDMVTVRRLILSGVPEMLKDAAKSDLAGGLLSDLASSFLATPKEEFGSILSHAQRNTEILDNPYICDCLTAEGEGPEVNFADWRTGTMSVFLCLSAPKFPVFNRWLRLVLTAALDEMTDTLNPPPQPVAFVLDEVATLGHLQVLENSVGLAAGYGIQLIYIFQDTAQMRNLYKGRWASFISNAGIRALFNLDDYDTAMYWAKTIGTHLVENVSQQQNIYGQSTGQNVNEAMRPLISSDEIMLRFASKRMMILPQGSHPVVTDRVAYFDDDGLKGRWDDPRGPLPAPLPLLPEAQAAQ